MEKKKLTIGIIFGGKTAEHEVSLQSAKNVYQAIDRNKYNPILIGITKQGTWLLQNESEFLLNADNPKHITLDTKTNTVVALIPQSNGSISYISNQKQESQTQTIDVAFPILHGPLGEDGTVQGLLKLANIPFVGASVLGSAVGMDKDVMKRLLRDAGIPIGKFVVVKSHENIPDFEEIKNKLALPLFIKPANMGSSVGVSKVNTQEEYLKAISHAFEYDSKIIIEEFIKGREIECSVLGNEYPKASVPGEVIASHDFYSYDAKYIDEQGAAIQIPAKLSQESIKAVQDIAIKTFQVLECEGLGRVDVFLKENGDIVVNEINTIPGFTKISMYPKMWEASGISYTQLIDRLIELARERFNKEQKLKTVC